MLTQQTARLVCKQDMRVLTHHRAGSLRAEQGMLRGRTGTAGAVHPTLAYDGMESAVQAPRSSFAQPVQWLPASGVPEGNKCTIST